MKRQHSQIANAPPSPKQHWALDVLEFDRNFGDKFRAESKRYVRGKAAHEPITLTDEQLARWRSEEPVS